MLSINLGSFSLSSSSLSLLPLPLCYKRKLRNPSSFLHSLSLSLSPSSSIMLPSSSASGKESYTTVAKPSNKVLEVKKSKFIAWASFANSEDSALQFLQQVKKSKFIAWASFANSEDSALQFLQQVREAKATHNCWAYKIGDAYRSNDDGEPGGTAGRPIHSSIIASGLDRVMVVVIRYFGGIKLGTGGLARAYGGVSLDCLKEAETIIIKPKVQMEVKIPYDLLGILYTLLQAYSAEKLQEDFDVSDNGVACLKIEVDLDRASSLEQKIANSCSGRAEVTFEPQ